MQGLPVSKILKNSISTSLELGLGLPPLLSATKSLNLARSTQYINMAITEKTYKISKTDNESIPIVIAEAPCKAEGLSLVIWSSSFMMSNLLYKLNIERSQLQPKDETKYSVLELGAGVGLSGISAAAVWGTRSLLTDLPTIVPGLQVNADHNTEVLRENGGHVACGTLDWNEPDTITIHDPTSSGRGLGPTIKVVDETAFPVILAADTMYTDEHPRLLTQTILKCLKRSSTARAVILHPLRLCYIEHTREFWARMEEGGLVAAEEGRDEIDLKEWDDERLHEWSLWKWKDL